MDSNRLDEIATSLDDIATTLDELEETSDAASAVMLNRIRQAIEKASDAVDRLENRESRSEAQRRGN